MALKYAVVGATGNVGREILQILPERGIQAKDVTAIASSNSVGAEVSYGEEDVLKIHDLASYDFEVIKSVIPLSCILLFSSLTSSIAYDSEVQLNIVININIFFIISFNP